MEPFLVVILTVSVVFTCEKESGLMVIESVGEAYSMLTLELAASLSGTNATHSAAIAMMSTAETDNARVTFAIKTAIS